jgi:hypothetical protein
MRDSAARRQSIRDAVRRHGKPASRLSATKKLLGSAALLGVGIWLLLWTTGAFSPSAAVAELRTLVDQEVTRLNRVARNEIPYSERGPDMGDFFQKVRDLPDSQRTQVRNEMGRLFAARERAEFGSYFALPPAQRIAELDRRIKESEARRKQWAAERAARSQATQASGASNGRPPASSGARPAGGPPSQPSGTGQARGPSGQGPQWSSRGPRTEEARNERRKERLDASSPAERAKRTEYRRALSARREQLGLSSSGRGGSGRRPG